ncbi:MAG: dethiobiotin synthase [Candidatus Altiarchaeota archaeon]|nr:dethiobiotin synthase [Candidatus Altiarchaeota archaeon]
MSYQLTVLGFGYSQELQVEGGLEDALKGLDAKFTSFEFGTFLHEIADMPYKEVDGGMYAWMLYHLDNAGQMKPVEQGLKDLSPKDGDRIFALYQFFSTGIHSTPGAYERPSAVEMPEAEWLDYVLEKPEEYIDSSLIEYQEFEPEVEDLTPLLEVFFDEDELPTQFAQYSLPEFNFNHTSLQALYTVVFPKSLAIPQPINDIQNDSELEHFLMDILSEAKFEGVLEAINRETGPIIHKLLTA